MAATVKVQRAKRRQVDAVVRTEAVRLGKSASRAADRFGHLHDEKALPVLLERRSRPAVLGRGQAPFAAEPGEGRSRFGVAQKRGRDNFRDGDLCPDVFRAFFLDVQLDQAARVEIKDHRLFASTADAALPAGAVVTIEPGIYRAGWGGVRIEDDVHLAEDGPVVLTSFSRDLLVIG